MKRWILSMTMVASLALLSLPVEASSMAGCSLFARIVKVKGSYGHQSPHLKGLPVDLHILGISRELFMSPNFCYDQLLVGTLRSVVLRGDKAKLSALQEGSVGIVNYKYTSNYHPRTHKMLDGHDWHFSRKYKPGVAEQRQWAAAGTPYSVVKKRLALLERTAASGQGHIYYVPKKDLLPHTYTTCKVPSTGPLPPYCMFSIHIASPHGRFYTTISFGPLLARNLSLKAFKKHFSYISVESTPLPLQFAGWHTHNNRTYSVLRQDQLGKRVKLLLYEKGVLYGEVSNTISNLQITSIKPPCAPLQLSGKLPPSCRVTSKKKIPVTFYFALPLGKAYEMCQKDPTNKRCR